MSPLRIALVHYHLRPGGVTSVLARTVSALATHPVRVAVLCGDAAAAGERFACPVQTVTGLDYGAGGGQLADDLLRAASERLGGPPDVWHIHNHAIGKNAALPRAVAQLAKRGARLLLHIHDFAEDGRPENYQCLRGELDHLYPVGPGVHLALLNQRDRGFVMQAGCSSARAHLLPNPIALPGAELTSPPRPGVMLYPTRAIRRKNLGEFLLWSILGPADTRWQTTLEPRTASDRPAYERWQAVAREVNAPVDFAVGARQPRSMTELLAGAAAVVTTSVAEGFGLSFLEPWLAGRPVFGRDLPDITVDFKAAGLDLGMLYPQLTVPAAWVGVDRLRAAISQGLRQLRTAYGQDCTRADVEGALAAALSGDRVEFGHLDEAMQEKVLRELAGDAGARRLLRPPQLMSAVTPEQLAHNRRIVRDGYSEEVYGRRLLDSYAALLGDTGVDDALDATRLLGQFLSPAHFNLLRT